MTKTKERKALDASNAQVSYLVSSVSQIWCEIPVGPKWTAALRISHGEPRGEPVIGEVRIFPTDSKRPRDLYGVSKASIAGKAARAPRGGVNSRVLKQVRLADALPFVREALTMLRILRKQPREALSLPELAGFAVPESLFPKPRRKTPGRGRPPKHDDSYYARIASAYADAKVAGNRSPAETVARRLKLPSAAYVRVVVQRAKEKGLVVGGRAWTLTAAGQKLLSKS